MSSNSEQMTLEERVVQTLKDDTLMKLVGDEDAIAELVKRALYEALYQPKRIPKGYGGYEQRDSVVVAAARNAATEACAKAVPELVASMFEREEVKKALADAVAAAVPGLIHEGVRMAMESTAHFAVENLREQLRLAGVNA